MFALSSSASWLYIIQIKGVTALFSSQEVSVQISTTTPLTSKNLEFRNFTLIPQCI